MASWMLTYTSPTIPRLIRLVPRLSLLPWHPRILPHITASGRIFASSLSLSSLDDPTPSMVAMSQQYVPSSGWDSFLFEDVSEEYTEQDAVPAQPSVPQTSSEALAQLVRKGNLTAAKTVKRTLEELGVPIQPDACYLAAAIRVLTEHRPGDKGDHVACQAFNSWAALAPLPPQAQNDPFFRSAAFTECPAYVAPLLRHSLIAAYMGRVRSIASIVVPHIARNAPPSCAKAFMAAFAAADRVARGPGPNNQSFKQFYGLAIRTSCLRNSPDDAMDLLLDAKSRGYRVTFFTLTLLAQCLRRAGPRANDIQLVEREMKIAEEAPRMSATPSKDPPASPLADRHLLLRRFWTALNKGHMPSRYALRTFFHECVRHRDHKTYRHAFYLFRRYRPRNRAFNHWGSVEIAYYLRVGQEQAACRIFNSLFFDKSLPKAVRQMLHIVARDGQQRNSSIKSERPIAVKVWPNARVTFLLWRTLVKLLKPRELGKIYAEFCSHFSSVRERYSYIRNPLQKPPGIARKEAKGFVDLAARRPVDAPFPYDFPHFRLFLRAYARLNNPNMVARIVRRMSRLGWRPRRGDVMTISRTFAGGGCGRRLARLLDKLRRDAELYDEGRAQRRLAEFAQQRSKSGEMGQAIASGERTKHVGMYRGAIRSMIQNHRWGEAAFLARHLRRRLKYKIGTDKRTDKVLGNLYHILMEVSNYR